MFTTKFYIILAIIVVVIVLAYLGYKKVKSVIENRQAKKEYEKSVVTGTVGGQAYTFNAATVADEIYAAMHQDCMWGACEYEERAITAINNVPKPFMPLVVNAYMNLHKLNLSSDMQKLMDSGNFERVRAQFM